MKTFFLGAKGALGLLAFFFVVRLAGAGPVVINEIMYHPPPAVPENSGKEWIELANTGTNTVDLEGWRFSQGIHFTFPHAALRGGGFLVVASDLATFRATYPGVTNVIGNWTGKLANNGETLQLVDQNGQVADSVSYSTEGDWALRRAGEIFPGQPDWWRGWRWTTPADGGGSSLELINPALPNQYGQNWAASLAPGGTPGRSNSVATNHAAPLILEVKNWPARPRSTNRVSVTARVLDDAAANLTVTLFHRVDGTASFTATPMVDDGSQGDGLAGDGVYGAELPPQPDRTVVEFYVRAADATGHARTWPAPTDDAGSQGANALYQVDDSTYSGPQPIYRFIVTAGEWNVWLNLMDNVSRGRYSDAAMNATLVRTDGAGTEVRYRVSIRNRGVGSRAAHPHNFHLSIPSDNPLSGLTRLDLNTRVLQAQAAGNAIFSLAGLPNAYGAPVQVRVNGLNLANASPGSGIDSLQFGSYYCFEPYNADWVNVHLPQDSGGNLYRGRWNFDWVKLANNGATLDYLGTNVAAYRQAYSPTGPTANTGAYLKQNNVSADDWSDLINLCFTLNRTSDADYLPALNQAVNIDEWLRYFAVNALILNEETSISTGVGDDYSLYSGVADPRFLLLNHDMDTVLGQGGSSPNITRSIFAPASLPAVARFLKNPAIAPRYYAALKRQADTTFAPEVIGPFLDQVLGGWVPTNYIQNLKDVAAQRRNNVLAQIPLTLEVQSSLPVSAGYPRTTSPTTTLSGRANAIQTRTVLVNGEPAVYVPWQASWTASNVALNPGINRVLVQSLDAAGSVFARTNIDLWYDDGAGTLAGGTLSSDTTWATAKGPFQLTSSLTVANGVTLTIEPGATVYLGAGVNLNVADGGRLEAEGTATAPIRFAVQPGSGVHWGNVTIHGGVGSPESRIAYAHFESNASSSSTPCIEVAGGTAFLDHLTFGNPMAPYIHVDGASFVISHCTFPSPATQFEPVHGTGGIKAGGRGIVRDCYFGVPIGYNDVVDFTGGNRDLGQPIVQFYNNVFTGATDDILDLDGTDAWIEGNIFLHSHRNGSPDSSSGVSGGDYNFGGSIGDRTSEITIVRNIFYDCDQAVTAKQGNFYTLFNNTIVHTTKTGGQDTASGVVNVQDVGTTFGAGCYLEGNIIQDAEQLVRNYDPARTTVTFTNNILPVAWPGPGGGNSTDDPRLKHIPQLGETQFATWEQAQVMWDWFSLRPGSPARGAGPNGVDLGAVISGGASISGEPPAVTADTSATLTVGVVRTGHGIPTGGFPEGSGYVAYRWRLDGGSWSAESPTGVPIGLTNLADGPHQVEVIGKRDSGWYQNASELGQDAVVSKSRTWTVDRGLHGVVINELLAVNRGAFRVGQDTPDTIELFNRSALPADLAGMGLSDDASKPYKFTFPAGSVLGGQQYLVLIADTGVGTNLNTGFRLNQEGGALFLTGAPSQGGTLLDSVTYGHQLPNDSIGRLATGGWGLTQATLGAPNLEEPTGDLGHVRLNEWLAASRYGDDFVELFNGDDLPVNVGRCFLSDLPATWPARNEIAPLCFLPAEGELVFLADGRGNAGANHLNFKLAHEWGALGLFAPDLTPLDQIVYGPQAADVSMGRSPDGGETLAFFTTPTPGSGNPGGLGPCTVSSQTISLMSYTQTWKYNQTQNLDGVNWSAANYDDSAWPAGEGLLAYENNSAIVPLIRTPLADPRQPPPGLTAGHADYFRTGLKVTNDLSAFTVTAKFRCDDGAMVYLNGNLLQSIRLPAGPIYNQTFATGFAPFGGSDATGDESFTFPGTLLQLGTNFFAVSVHQANSGSSDVVWGMALEAVQSVTNCTSPQAVLNEVMANNRSVPNPDGTITDWVELSNPSGDPVDLTAKSFASDPANPRRWVFPSGATVPPGGFLVVRFDPEASASVTSDGVLNTGFGLDAGGDEVLFYDTPPNGGGLLDSVSFGPQAPDFSIGRTPDTAGAWTLTLPTPGTGNAAAPLGNPSALRINEWMADPLQGHDWFELFNPDPRPVGLGGLFLTDNLNQPAQFPIAPLSFIGAGPGAYAVFQADGAPTRGPDHVNFKLAAGGESIGLFGVDDATRIDSVNFGPQTAGVSEGRLPDGSSNVASLSLPTPGAPNNSQSDSDGDGIPDAWMMQYFHHPTGQAADHSLANQDADGDGMSNWQEYLAGTDPTQAGSVLRLDVVEVKPGNSAVLSFTAAANHSYTLQFQDSLATGTWQKLQDIAAESVTQTYSLTNSNAGGTARFYRLVTPAQN